MKRENLKKAIALSNKINRLQEVITLASDSVDVKLNFSNHSRNDVYSIDLRGDVEEGKYVQNEIASEFIKILTGILTEKEKELEKLGVEI